MEPSQVPDVLNFLTAVAELETFRALHGDIFDQYAQLVERYNQTLEAADKKVRALGITCGPFDRYQTSTSYDPKALYDAVGHDRFLQVGGDVHTEKVFKIDKAKVEVAIEQGRIPQEAVDSFRTISPRYHKPEKITI